MRQKNDREMKIGIERQKKSERGTQAKEKEREGKGQGGERDNNK